MCFCVHSLVRYKNAALLLFGDTAQGCCLLPAFLTCTGRWGELNRELWERGHARVFRPIFQTCISQEAFPFSFHHAPQLSLETHTTPAVLVGLTPGYAPYKHHRNFLSLRCFGHTLHQRNGLPLSWRGSIASIHPGFCNAFQSDSSSQLVASASHITGSQGFCLS